MNIVPRTLFTGEYRPPPVNNVPPPDISIERAHAPKGSHILVVKNMELNYDDDDGLNVPHVKTGITQILVSK